MQMSIIKMQKSTMIACVIAVALFVLSGFGGNAVAADRVTICHKGVKTATVAAPAVSAHQAHGDTLGACGSVTPPSKGMAAVVMMRCGPDGDTVKIVAFSSSPLVEPSSDDCAVALGELLDARYYLKSITSGSAGEDALNLYTDYLLLGKADDIDGDDDDDDNDDVDVDD